MSSSHIRIAFGAPGAAREASEVISVRRLCIGSADQLSYELGDLARSRNRLHQAARARAEFTLAVCNSISHANNLPGWASRPLPPTWTSPLHGGCTDVVERYLGVN